MSAQHTPGPWVTGPASWERNGDVRYTLVGIKEANWPDCRLIAAAPDLLEALRHFAALDPDHPPAGILPTAWSAALEAARAAIAKATGEEA